MSYTAAVSLNVVLGLAVAVLVGLLLATREQRNFFRLDAELLTRIVAGRDAEAAQFARRFCLARPASLRDQPDGQAIAAADAVQREGDALVAKARRMLAGEGGGAATARPEPAPARTA